MGSAKLKIVEELMTNYNDLSIELYGSYTTLYDAS